MSSSTPVPKHVPATAGVQPGAPNATRESDPVLADGPPASEEEVGLETTD